MHRRDFLGFLSVAPLAVAPTALGAPATAAPAGEVAGPTVAERIMRDRTAIDKSELREWMSMIERAVISHSQMRERFRLGDLPSSAPYQRIR